jgi:hypothetical protein
MPRSITIHKNRIIRLLERYPSRLEDIFPPGRFIDSTKAIKDLESSPFNWFVDGTLTENGVPDVFAGSAELRRRCGIPGVDTTADELDRSPVRHRCGLAKRTE